MPKPPCAQLVLTGKAVCVEYIQKAAAAAKSHSRASGRDSCCEVRAYGYLHNGPIPDISDNLPIAFNGS